MTDKKIEVFLGVYQQYCEQVRHHQEERRTIANTLVVVIAALVAVAAIDQKLNESDRPVAIAVAAVGAFGAVCMVKCHGLIRHYKNVAAEVAVILSQQLSCISSVEIEKHVQAKENPIWRFIGSIRLWWLWFILFLIIVIAGLKLIFFSLSDAKPPPVQSTTTSSGRQ